MALTEKEIQEHKALVEKVNKLNTTKQEIMATGRAKKEQALEILKTYGYIDLKDISKLQEKLEEMEEKIKEERRAIEEEVIEIGNLKDAVDAIILS